MVNNIVLSARNLCKEFSGNGTMAPALNKCNLELRKGELLFICGPNGSGKTTLLRVLAGMIEYQGKIEYHANDGQKFDWNSVRDGLCVWVPQEVGDAIAYSVRIDEIISISHRHELSNLAKHLGLDWIFTGGKGKLSKQLVGNLSGGQRQLLVGLLAISGNRSVLLLDEVFRSLDDQIRDKYLEMVRTAVKQSNGSALIVSHDLDFTVKNADRILAMRRGSITREFIPTELDQGELISQLASELWR